MTDPCLTAQLSLRDLISCFRQIGAEAEAAAASSDPSARFHEGRATAYREVLEALETHALASGLCIHELGMAAFDPMSDALEFDA